MTPKATQHIIRGMRQDTSNSKASKEFAFHNHNIRITAREDHTLLSITNEKMPSYINDTQGNYIGHCVLGDYLVLFIHQSDNIDKIEIAHKDKLDTFNTIYEGNLNFSIDNPIEALGVYENEDIQKVYWVDGRNQPRVINIKTDEKIRENWNNTSFNFISELELKDEVSIKPTTTVSNFAPGVIQYAFTYYNKYMSESNIFNISSLNYIAHKNRGGASDEVITDLGFEITLSNLDSIFEYVRIYSIHRTSLDSIPTVKIVKDFKLPPLNIEEINKEHYYYSVIGDYDVYHKGTLVEPSVAGKSFTVLKNDTIAIKNKNKEVCNLVIINDGTVTYTKNIEDNKTTIILQGSKTPTFKISGLTENMKKPITFIDNGNVGNTIDPTFLLYVGGEYIIPKNILAKDNTLFLSNIKLNNDLIIKKDEIKAYVKPKYIEVPITKDEYYPYSNQLVNSEESIKTFKYGETYRIGLQFQSKSGRWSEPIFIEDYTIDGHPTINDDSIKLINCAIVLSYISNNIKNNYKRYRSLIVFPEKNERTVIAQGILCPTVYNVRSRYTNNPFSQSSWFIRPNIPYDASSSDSESIVFTNNSNEKFPNIANNGSWTEFRHNFPIPNNWERNAEIQCLVNVPKNPYMKLYNEENFDNTSYDYIEKNQEYYFIDQSILTFHSPDLEFDNDKNYFNGNHKLRIIGAVGFNNFISDISIQTNNPALEGYPGFVKFSVEYSSIKSTNEEEKVLGSRGLSSGVFWLDALVDDNNENIDKEHIYGYFVYPWHRSGPLNNAQLDWKGTPTLKKKKLSNLKVSNYIHYLNSHWETEKDENHTGITPCKLFDSDNMSLLKIDSPRNSELPRLNYFGNIDTISNISLVNDPFIVREDKEDVQSNRNKGYPIIISDKDDFPASDFNQKELFNDFPEALDYNRIEPVRIKYKSSPHIVFALNYTNDGKQIILPTTNDTNLISSYKDKEYPFWDKNKKGIYQDVIPMSTNDMPYGYLWLAELYNDNISNKFGGTSEEAFKNNLWLPAGPIVPLNKEAVINQGDTYFQRYDCLKTYAYTPEDENQVVEIASFMCETRFNIDGRYDNRGNYSNLNADPTNFNLFNPVYSQKDNFFNYRILDSDRYKLNNFPNTITWSKEKHAGEDIDTWTNITMANILDIDGSKGEIKKLVVHNNRILAFQEKGIAEVLFNSRVQIPTSDGVPIEITNGYKVEGFRYISDGIGSKNKNSILTTPSGVYFLDSNSNSIYLLTNGLTNLSTEKGFEIWTKKVANDSSFKTFYDNANKDVYFTTKDECLGYSEKLGEFTSFYDYYNSDSMFNIGNSFYRLYYDSNLYLDKMFVGDYTNKYSIEFITNEDTQVDKVFTTIDYRADFFDSNNDAYLEKESFDTIEVWNEYQRGEETLKYSEFRPSNLKKKFRIWSANIPRDEVNKLDRMRNPWLHIKLSKNTPGTSRMELHDIVVKYLE